MSSIYPIVAEYTVLNSTLHLEGMFKIFAHIKTHPVKNLRQFDKMRYTSVADYN